MGYVVVKQELGNQIYHLIGETEKAIICVQIGLTSLVQLHLPKENIRYISSSLQQCFEIL